MYIFPLSVIKIMEYSPEILTSRSNAICAAVQPPELVVDSHRSSKIQD